MATDRDKADKRGERQARTERLAAALRDNLRRRKAQARGRREIGEEAAKKDPDRRGSD
jgi:hypothetical protein